jgi:quinoprotein glucose dehydrogenase
MPSISPPWYSLAAFDLNNGTKKWEVPYGTIQALVDAGHSDTGTVSQRGGPVLTANGMLFTATNDRKFRAWDTDTGKVIFEMDLPAASEGVPAVYEIGGREYIAICAAQGAGPQMEVPGFPKKDPAPFENAYVVLALPKK